MTLSSKQKLSFVLIFFLVLLTGAVTVYLSIDHLLSEPITIKDVKVDTGSTLKLNILQQISKKNGITEWELTADTATLLKKEDKAVLQNIRVIFYTKDQQKIHLTSQTGNLNTKTHDMTFSGNVTVQFDETTLSCDKLQYHKKEHIIHTDSHVKIKRAESVIDADSMTTRLNENMTILSGHVRGTFSEDFDI